MASTLGENSVKSDHIIFDEIFNLAYPNICKRSKQDIKSLINDGVLQMDALFEQAISVVGNLERESVEGRDFVDFSDAKKVTVQWLYETGAATRRVATVRNIRGKQGWLRVIAAETLTDTAYFFKIPKEAYKDISCIRIYFNEDGSPKLDGKWFRYHCATFEELSEPIPQL